MRKELEQFCKNVGTLTDTAVRLQKACEKLLESQEKYKEYQAKLWIELLENSFTSNIGNEYENKNKPPTK